MVLFFIFCAYTFAQSSGTGKESNSNNTETPPSAANQLPLYNLFYLSKFITSKNSESKDRIYNALTQQIGKENINNLLKDSLYINVKTFLSEYENSITIGILENLSKDRNDTSLQELKKQKDTLDNLTKLGIQINNRISDLDILEKILKNIDNDSLKKDTSNNFLLEQHQKVNKNRLNIEGMRLNNLCNESFLKNPDSLSSFLNCLIKNTINEKTELKKYKENILKTSVSNKEKEFSSLLKSKTKEILENQTESRDIKFYFENLIETKNNQNTQISIITASQNAQQSLSYSGLNIPSQSQMIEAMAIFLAKRAKQEAAIWFMDQLRERVKNPLIYDTFPETIALLDNLEEYHTANFGKSWRYAIANDFVKMPKNLVNGNWIKQTLPADKQKDLKIAVDFGYDLNSLIMERYNYRDIIRNFYLNPAYAKNNETELSKSLRKSFVVLYIATNELFTLHTVDNKPTYRLLSYEELKTLDQNQWNTFIELLKLKYGLEFSDLYTKMGDQAKEYQNITKWISNLLISLNQFDKINQEQQQLLKSDKSDNTGQSLTSIWKVLDQVIKGIDIAPYTDAVSNSPMSKHLESVQHILGIIEDIQQKNFTAATQKTLKLADQFYGSKYESPDLNKISLNINDTLLILKSGSEKEIFKTKFTLPGISQLAIQQNSVKIKYQNIGKQDSITLTEKELEQIKRIALITGHLNEKDRKKILKEFSDTSKTTINDLINNTLKEKKFKFFEIISFYQKITSQSDLQGVQKSISAYSNLLNPQNLNDLKTLIISGDNSQFGSTYLHKYGEQLLKLTSFFGDVMATQDANALAQVIESYALPPTSYKLKQKMKTSVDLNAYVGAFGGKLFTHKYASLSKQFTGGITAPIGITYKNNGLFKHINLHAQLLDLGNIVNHYLITPDSAYNKEVHFTEVFSPGLNILYSIKNTPLVIFIGGKGIPLKSYYDETLNAKMNTRVIDAWVFSLGLKLDIPLLNLYSR
ncbi:hypothetical protein [Sphingobacterium spiritivorum]|uniref:Uncharacterized protein n=2 Tax=Sphingobacterium spiritivorum TaxID=258 RepID=D7VQF7_SPHSI|nr:hypothetical protein HMPREF0766_13211 [Sphingobacterium spiritivorum ATCC 33861]QQT37849.1 hypothetical protein I6J01_00095 [Sphingobacterium spiritivorum]